MGQYIFDKRKVFKKLILKDPDFDPDSLSHETDPRISIKLKRIRIRIKIKRLRNTVFILLLKEINHCELSGSFRIFDGVLNSPNLVLIKPNSKF